MTFLYFLFRLAAVIGAIILLILLFSAMAPSGLRVIPFIGIILVIIFGFKWLVKF
jgi:hypothetical protein